MKKKMQIITLDLGLTDTSIPDKDEKTTKNIDEAIKEAKTQKELIEKGKKKRAEVHIDKAFQLLMEATNEGLEVPTEDLMEISKAKTSSSLILRLKNKIKQEGAHWEIKKRKSKGITYYSLKPSTITE